MDYAALTGRLYRAPSNFLERSDSSWVRRTFSTNLDCRATDAQKPVLQKRTKYKPVHRKYRLVPTYMPNPESQQFRTIPPPEPLVIPKKPMPWRKLPYGKRVTLERMEMMLGNIEEGILNEEETDLLCYVVHKREKAFAFEFSEKGFFDSKYYPDYEIPVIEHTPWQRPPIRVPHAIIEEVKSEIRTQEAAGRFEPTVSSYRSAMFAVAKKKG
ncbi:hypothetical protein K435DRAFT_685878, partial [Dendrothele bispora CBS 962.96]